MHSMAENFVRHALKIGAFELDTNGQKENGRISPYRFNSKPFQNGKEMPILATAYIKTVADMINDDNILLSSGHGSTSLVITMSTEALAQHGIKLCAAFSRKKNVASEEIIGISVKKKKVLVISDGMMADSFNKTIAAIHENGGIPIGCVIAFDRQERIAGKKHSIVQEFQKKHGIPVRAVATLSDLILVLGSEGESNILKEIIAYREKYCV